MSRLGRTERLNRTLNLGCLFAGIAILIAGRVVESLRGSLWAGVALILIGLSFLIDSLLPGGSKMSNEQVVMLKRVGIPYRPGGERPFFIAIGLIFAAAGTAVILA